MASKNASIHAHEKLYAWANATNSSINVSETVVHSHAFLVSASIDESCLRAVFLSTHGVSTS